MKSNALLLSYVAALMICCGCQHRVSGVVGRVQGIDGLTEQQLIVKMGEPLRRDKFMASASAGEFRTGLERIAARLQKEDVRIHELTWDRVDYLVTAWLYETNGNWIAFDSLKYGKNVRF
jgi:hypothetical protein